MKVTIVQKPWIEKHNAKFTKGKEYEPFWISEIKDGLIAVKDDLDEEWFLTKYEYRKVKKNDNQRTNICCIA